MPELTTDLANVLAYEGEQKSRLRELDKVRRKSRSKKIVRRR